MQEKLKFNEIIIVEGKYDAIKLNDIADALIIPIGGFGVFKSDETKQLIKTLGKKKGIIVLTDSDDAGFKIRRYINNIAQNLNVKNAYIPAIKGKEKRKEKPSKEGLLGVEGIDKNILVQALSEFAINNNTANKKNISANNKPITYTHLFEAGLSGTAESATKRRELLNKINLPPRLSKKALLHVLNSLYSYEEFCELL